jgi:hypothetical protein
MLDRPLLYTSLVYQPPSGGRQVLHTRQLFGIIWGLMEAFGGGLVEHYRRPIVGLVETFRKPKVKLSGTLQEVYSGA